VLTVDFTESEIAQVTEATASINEATGSAGWYLGIWDPLRGTIEVSQPNMDPQGFIRIGSVTKSMTAVTVLRLVEQGVLALAAPVSGYVPDLPNGDQITIEMLLNMTAGLPNIMEAPGFLTDYYADPNRGWTVADSLNAIRAMPPTGAPGEQQQYNNSNYIVLGEVIAAATGVPVTEVMAQEVLMPARLISSAFPIDPQMPQPAVPGVMTIDGEDRNVDLQNPQIPSTAGFAISTVGDLRSWASQLTSGDLLNDATFTIQLPPPATEEPTYGMGLADFGGWLGHNGSVAGFGTMMLREPQSGAVLVAVSTGGGPVNPAPDVVAFKTIATLYPGQFPLVEKLLAESEASLEE
jgi:D-alanyl-D-alanine carboxypeptidase